MEQQQIHRVFHQLGDREQEQENRPPPPQGKADEDGQGGGEGEQQGDIPSAVDRLSLPPQRTAKQPCADMSALLPGKLHHPSGALALAHPLPPCQLHQPLAVGVAAVFVHPGIDPRRVLPEDCLHGAGLL